MKKGWVVESDIRTYLIAEPSQSQDWDDRTFLPTFAWHEHKSNALRFTSKSQAQAIADMWPKAGARAVKA